MPDIVLSTINARYIHASLGLRCLRANLGELRERSVIAEFETSANAVDIVEQLLALEPKIIGVGVYIWNTNHVLEVVQLLKKLAPAVRVVLGGPEVSHETMEQPLTALADTVIVGEGDLAFRALCEQLLNTPEARAPKVVRAPLPDVATMALPYSEHSNDDLAHRILYVEASRGCPFSCEFCLSSLDEKVRNVPLERLFAAFDDLLERGAKQFKFVDRTFNLKVDVSLAILNFFLERMKPGLFLHFEMVPDRLPDALKAALAKFPAGSVQLEVGIQTFDPQVARNVSRRQDWEKTEANFEFLRAHTGVHVHADLIAGLPGETFSGFAQGFDRLWAMRPHEIQVELLKRLRGTPLIRHEGPEAMRFAAGAPYEVLQTKTMSFAELQRLRRFSKTLDRFVNAGHFPKAMPLLLGTTTSAFERLEHFSQWLHAQGAGGHGISLSRQFRFLRDYMRSLRCIDDAVLLEALRSDYALGRSDRPDWLFGASKRDERGEREEKAPIFQNSRRQARHHSV